MSSLNLNVSSRMREPSRGSLQIEEERSIFGRLHSSAREKKTIDPAPSMRRLEEMLTKEGGKERDFFGKIYSSVKERKTPPPPDIVPSLQRLEDMIAKESRKDKEKERERKDSEKIRKTKTKEDKSEGNSLNGDALKKLEDFYKEDSNVSSTPLSRNTSSPSTNPFENPKSLYRKDSLRSLPSYHTHKKSIQSRGKDTSLKTLSIKRDVSAMEIDASQKKRGTFSYSRWRREREGDDDTSSVSTRGKRATVSSSKGPDDGTVSRKYVQRVASRFEDLRNANIERIQSTLSTPTAPMIVSSRLPTTLLPPLTLSRPTKRKKEAEAWNYVKPSSSFRIPQTPPPLPPPLSPRSPKVERSSPSSRAAVSILPVIEPNGNINNTINHNSKADTLLRRSSSTTNINTLLRKSSSNNISKLLRKSSSNNINTNKPPTTDIQINYSVITTEDNTTNITIAPASTDNKWLSLSNTQALERVTKPRAYSVDGRGTIKKELHVSEHRQAKDDSYI